MELFLDVSENEGWSKDEALVVEKMLREHQFAKREIELLEKLRKNLQEDLESLNSKKLQSSPPEELCDNIFTMEIMEDPVVAEDGFTYERSAILKWFGTKKTSPTTGAILQSTKLIPNCSLKSQINQWKERMVGARLQSTKFIPTWSLKSQINQWKERTVGAIIHSTKFIRNYLPKSKINQLKEIFVDIGDIIIIPSTKFIRNYSQKSKINQWEERFVDIGDKILISNESFTIYDAIPSLCMLIMMIFSFWFGS
jgi:hypothetical protein